MLRHGQGKLEFIGKNISYEGEWDSDYMNGKGIYRTPEKEYEGWKMKAKVFMMQDIGEQIRSMALEFVGGKEIVTTLSIVEVKVLHDRITR